MAFHLAPEPADPGEPQVEIGRAGGAVAGDHRRLVSDGSQVLAHGALICPGCQMPIEARRRLRATGPLRCGYCDHVAEARAFISEDVFDTLANEVYLVARVG
jgi:hypothetical protein